MKTGVKIVSWLIVFVLIFFKTSAQDTESALTDSIIKYKYQDTVLSKKYIKKYLLKFSHDSCKLKGNRCMADVYWYSGAFDSSIVYYKKALEYAIKIKNKKFEAGINNDIGYLYMEKNNYNKALEYYNKGQKISIDNNIGETKKLAMTYMGLIYSRLGDSTNALQYQRELLALMVKIKDESGEATILNNMGSTYFNSGDYKKAIEQYLKSAAIDKRLNVKFNYFQTIDNIGICYYRLEDYDNAIKYFDISIPGLIETNNTNSISSAYYILSNIYYKKNLMAKSQEYEKLYFEVFKRTNDTLTYMNFRGSRAPLEAERGEYKAAYEDIKLYYEYRDSVNIATHKKSLIDQQVEFDIGKKQNEIDLLNKDKELKEQEAKRKQFVIYFISGFCLLLLITVYIAIRSYLMKRKANVIISEQKEEVIKQKEMIEEHQKEILDSIHYAKRIQNALLGNKEFIDKYFSANFIYFNPKDIVSGDFYWATFHDDYFYLAVCDSTGHGVPGAFMSLLNIGFLSEAINEKEILEPSLVFDYARKRLVGSMSKEGQKDGFDGVLIRLNKVTKEIVFAAAHNKPILVSDKRLVELSADKMPVGYGYREDAFVQYTLQYKQGDMLYLYTDGYADQFGGPKGKKFKYRQLDELLLHISHLTPAEQQKALSETFDNWKGNLEQVDDVCVIGIRL